MVYPNRYSTTGVQLTKGGVVVHDSEGGEGGTSCEQLISFMEQPGTRVIEGSSPPRTYGSAYHAVANEDGNYVPVLGAMFGPFAAPPLNKTWWHIVIPGKASQTRAQWLDAASRPYIKAVAKFIYDKHLIDGFPLTKVGPVALRAAGATGLRVGYCGHVEVTAAWHQTDHTDPGGFFPWDVLAAEIALLTPPPPPLPTPLGDDMPIFARWKDSPGTWITIDANGWRKLPNLTTVQWYDTFDLARFVPSTYPGAVRVTVGGKAVYIAELDRTAGLGIGDALRRIPEVV